MIVNVCHIVHIFYISSLLTSGPTPMKLVLTAYDLSNSLTLSSMSIHAKLHPL